MVVAGSGEEVSASSCPIRVQLARDPGILLARAIVEHNDEHVTSQQSYVVVRCPAEKHTTFLSKKWQNHGVYNLCNVVDTVCFTLQKHQM